LITVHPSSLATLLLRISRAWPLLVLALLALPPAKAAFNTPYPFNGNQSGASNSYIDFDDNNCVGTATYMAGSVTRNGTGLARA